jgi:hypothetical protein
MDGVIKRPCGTNPPERLGDLDVEREDLLRADHVLHLGGGWPLSS